MQILTPGQEIRFRNQEDTPEHRYYVGMHSIAGELRYVIRQDFGIIEYVGHNAAFTAGTSRLPLLLTVYYARRI
jgi:hypothetical protein